jgi:transposase InsO family protein
MRPCAPSVQEKWPNDFMAERPNQKWAGDIGDIWTREGWLYLAEFMGQALRRRNRIRACL